MTQIYKFEKRQSLTEQDVYNAFKNGLEKCGLKDKRIMVLIPDSTRSGPYHQLTRILLKILKPVAEKIDFLIALGTHPVMTQEQIDKFLHISDEDKQTIFKDVNIFNHQWDKEETFIKIGEFSEKEIENLSDGLFKEKVPVTINKMIFDYDAVIVLGPVFPHEVVGFSGGVKYFFPGISGWEFLGFFHWFGAVLTNIKVNGVIDTQIRRLIEKAAEFIDIPKILIALDVTGDDIHGIFIGDIIKAWYQAAKSSSKSHIAYSGRRYSKVLGIAPEFYDDLWTAGKVMYKLESIVEDGGELVIYAPHVNEISYTHGDVIRKIGYHTRDYFLKQMERFKDFPRGVVAHSTHVKGIGTYEDGIEKPRITVTLATQIPEDVCKKINLNYRDHKCINIKEWENRGTEGILVVPQAGEILYQYRQE